MNNLKKTEYFISDPFAYNGLTAAKEVLPKVLTSATKLRDDFLTNHKENIAEIVNENIEFNTSTFSNASYAYVFAIITLNYYTK